MSSPSPAQDRHQVPGRVDTRCRAAVRGQPIGRGGHRLSRWHLRPPACPQRCTTAERAPGGMRSPQPRPCTARRAFASGRGSLAPSLRARDRCRRQTPARGLARFGRHPRGLPRSPPRRQRTTACRTFFIVSELQPMPSTCADTAPDSWSLPQACRVARMAASPTRLEPWSSASFPSGDTATSSTWLVLAAVLQSRRPSQRCTPSGCVVRFPHRVSVRRCRPAAIRHGRRRRCRRPPAHTARPARSSSRARRGNHRSSPR
jgi:hypothetical protein